jgi:anti-sigma factor RsiW
MKCSIAKSKIRSYLDSAVSERERQELGSHLRTCRSCADDWERSVQVHDAVRSLPRKEMPGDLAIRLRVIASQERNLRIGLGRTWWEQFSFRLNGLLRPLAVPLAGGISAAVVLFATLVPTLSHPVSTSDVPCVVFTQPMIESMSPIGFTPAADAVVDLRIDPEGRIVNYSIVESNGHVEAIHRSIENSLLFTRFKPATLAPNSCSDCGVPMSGTVRMVLRSSHIEVKG